jgi:hypothetical protein
MHKRPSHGFWFERSGRYRKLADLLVQSGDCADFVRLHRRSPKPFGLLFRADKLS